MLNRRTFLKASAAPFPWQPRSTLSTPIRPSRRSNRPARTTAALCRSSLLCRNDCRRLIRLLSPGNREFAAWDRRNMTEHDPAVMNVEEWADYWHSAKVDIVYISVTGILAFYPSKVPFHRHGKFFERPGFLRRMRRRREEERYARRGAHESRPQLGRCACGTSGVGHAQQGRLGAIRSEEPRLFKTCMFSTYMDDYVPAIMREINSLYDVDCFYTNGWPPLGILPDCHCAICSKLPACRHAGITGASSTARCWSYGRNMTLSPRRRSRTASISPTRVATCAADPISMVSARFAHGSRPTTRDAATTMPRCGDAACRAGCATRCIDGKIAANVTAATPPALRWPGAIPQKIPAKPRMWFNETLASGMTPYYHFVGAEDGFFEKTVAGREVGVRLFRLDGQARCAFHDPPFHCQHRRGYGTEHAASLSGARQQRSRAYMHETTQGIYDALLRGRFAFRLCA